MRTLAAFCLLFITVFAVASPPSLPQQFTAFLEKTRITSDTKKVVESYWLALDVHGTRRAVIGVSEENFLGKNGTDIKSPKVDTFQLPFFDRLVCYSVPDHSKVEKIRISLEAKDEGTETFSDIECRVYKHKHFLSSIVETWYVSTSDSHLVGYTYQDKEKMEISVYSQYVAGVPDDKWFNLPSGCRFMVGPSDYVDLYRMFPHMARKINERRADLLEPVQTDESIEAINNQNLGWTAGKNRFGDMTIGQAAKLMGAWPMAKPLHVKKPAMMIGELPKNFDSRSHFKHCSIIREIRDQGQCGSCWAVSLASVFSDRICIKTEGRNSTSMSAQYIMNCDEADNSCSGGLTDIAWNFVKDEGTTTSSCTGYAESDRKCRRNRCDNKDEAVMYKASEVYSPGVSVEAIKTEIMTHGPVQAAFFVWNDFMSYKDGVYRCTEGTKVAPLGMHAVRIMGWEHNAWIVANSWGEDTWGDKGTFKIIIGKGDCGMGDQIAAGIPAIN